MSVYSKYSNGWCGRILEVDLSSRRFSERETRAYAADYLGGRGIATRIYWESAEARAGAFDPANLLIFMTGPLGATGAQGASRFVVAGKSPMRRPEGFCCGNLGGYFGPHLKRAGFDGLVISGASDAPVYLLIEDGQAELRDAASLWGKGVYATAEQLKAEHGRTVRYVAAGVAGENRCRSATVLTDNEGSATGGFGAVMGSKRLKAVAVLGSGQPAVADPERLKRLNREAVRLNRREPLHLPFPQDQVCRTGKASCYQCGLDCLMRSTLQTASGRSMVRKCQAMFVYFPWVMRRPGEPAETALAATGICNDLGICTMEMANIIQWLDACHRAGSPIIAQTGLDMSALGTRAFFEALARMIARRQGFGDILAEGLLRAGDALGDDATRHFANEVAGVGDGATYSAREYPMNGLLYAFEPRQPIAMLHEVSRLVGFWVMHQADPASSPVDSDVFRAAAGRFWGHPDAWDLTTHAGKAQAAAAIMDRTLAKDSLMLCDSAWPLMVSWNTPDRVGDPSLESRIFAAVTGLDLDEAGLKSCGERIFNLQRAVLLREGRRPKTDDILAPFNYTDPVQSVFMNPEVIVPGAGDAVVSKKGAVLDPAAFEAMRGEFYALRGWDAASGCQRQPVLDALGLGDVAGQVASLGWLKD
jgi:aldehyde:ferredoxin oxidoreductase